jgi:hypothetical protein
MSTCLDNDHLSFLFERALVAPEQVQMRVYQFLFDIWLPQIRLLSIPLRSLAQPVALWIFLGFNSVLAVPASSCHPASWAHIYNINNLQVHASFINSSSERVSFLAPVQF